MAGTVKVLMRQSLGDCSDRAFLPSPPPKIAAARKKLQDPIGLPIHWHAEAQRPVCRQCDGTGRVASWVGLPAPEWGRLRPFPVPLLIGCCSLASVFPLLKPHTSWYSYKDEIIKVKSWAGEKCSVNVVCCCYYPLPSGVGHLPTGFSRICCLCRPAREIKFFFFLRLMSLRESC